ncbi:MAG TPA: hypothetical protein VFJ29_05150 [Candidatus Kapabacteria bacterium]|nr:hypothetical protein [Candidatus Kapabacteria bacterium]
MRSIRIISALLSVAAAFLFFACSKSNPVVQPSPVRAFSFGVGNSFVFNAWGLDTASTNYGNKIDSTLTIIHETITDSGATIAGVSGVYTAVDSSFTPAGKYTGTSTVYYAVKDSSLWAYGLVASMLGNLPNIPIQIPQNWNEIADNASGSTWLADTFSIQGNFPYMGNSVPGTAALKIMGRNAGDNTLSAAGNSLLCNHSVDSGGVDVSITAPIFGQISVGNLPLTFQLDVSYQPTVVAKIYNPPTKFSSTLYPFALMGTERDLVSWHTK